MPGKYGDYGIPMQGTSTGDAARLIGYYWEHLNDPEWVPVSKGGSYSRWCGLNSYFPDVWSYKCRREYGTITTPWDGSWFLPWERKTARPMFLTHVGTRAGDYWQSKKSFRYWRLARKQGMKNLLKTRAA